MSAVGLTLAAAGVLYAALSWWLMRCDRLTFGLGAQNVLGGWVLILAGLLFDPVAGLLRKLGADTTLASGAEKGSAGQWLLVALTLLLLGLLLRQSVARSAEMWHRRRLATRLALHAAEQGPVPSARE